MHELLLVLLSLIMIPWLAVLSRLHGSNDTIPKLANNYLYAMPYFWFACVLGYEWYWLLFILVGVMCTKPIPHQALMLRPHSTTAPRPTWVTKIVDVFVKDHSGRLDENIGWIIKGICIALPFSISAIFNHDFILSGVTLFAGAISSAVAYDIGWYKLNGKKGIVATDWGEFITGAIVGIGFFVGTILMLWYK